MDISNKGAFSFEIQKKLDEYSEIRKRMLKDKHCPIYHFTPPGGYMNDPNGLCFFGGNWHMFYQFSIDGVTCWGHAYSEDAVYWKDLPPAIEPEGKEIACWSGGVMIENNRAIAAYYSRGRGIAVAVSSDPLLMKWEKIGGDIPVIPMPGRGSPEAEKYSVYDPFIWKNDGKYYIISGKFIISPVSGKREREEFLFVSDDLVSWTYLHPFLEHDHFSRNGDDGACPYFLPLGSKYVLFHYSHMSGPKYMIGNYDKDRDKFVVSEGEALTGTSSFLGGLLAPSAFPEKKDSLRIIYNIAENRKAAMLNQVMSLPSSVSFSNQDEDQLFFKPIQDIERLRSGLSVRSEKNVLLPANLEYVMEGLKASSSEIIVEFEAKNIPALEIRVFRSPDCREYTSVCVYRQRGNVNYRHFREPDYGFRKCHDSVLMLDMTNSSLDCGSNIRTPEMQSVYLAPEENLIVHIFLDKSVVEVYLNDRIFCVGRVYPFLDDSKGVSIRPIGGDITMKSFECYDMKSIFECGK